MCVLLRRLLFHRVRPVFVFDGATPVLKQRTLVARRRRKEGQVVRVQRQAEQLLMNQLKCGARCRPRCARHSSPQFHHLGQGACCSGTLGNIVSSNWKHVCRKVPGWSYLAV